MIGVTMQRGPHSRKQHGRYNPSAPDYYAVHRRRPARTPFWTLPEKPAADPPKSQVPSRRWRCFGAGKLPVVRANTKSEARARFKALLNVGRLPADAVVMAA